MSDLWYWRSSDRTRGPLVTEELEAIVLSQRLQDGDAVRLEGTDEWLPAAEIRQMFAGSRESPAETAAKLLQTAAARRVKGGSSPGTRAPWIGAMLANVPKAGAAFLLQITEAASRALLAAVQWLGHRGRILLTVLLASAAVWYLAWRFVPWGESDLARVQRLKAVWKQMQSRPPQSPQDAEITQWLDATETDLASKLKTEPISGASGVNRQKALARREMLFAAREIRQPEHNANSRERIDESLESATNYLLQMPAGPNKSTTSESNTSAIVVAVLVVDVIVLAGVAAWWFFGRQRR